MCPLGLWRVNIRVVDRKSRVGLVGIGRMGVGMGRLGMGRFRLRRLRRFSSRNSSSSRRSIMRVLILLHKIKSLRPRRLKGAPLSPRSCRTLVNCVRGTSSSKRFTSSTSIVHHLRLQKPSPRMVCSPPLQSCHHLVHVLFRVCSWTAYVSTSSWFPHTHRIFNGRPWARCTRAQRHTRLCG